jgi:hypothetical protein
MIGQARQTSMATMVKSHRIPQMVVSVRVFTVSSSVVRAVWH